MGKPKRNTGSHMQNVAIEKLAWLENGDKLSRYEFERRYHAMPWLKHAELVEGIVYMASPLRYEEHGKPHGLLMTWLGTYAAFNSGVELADNATVRLDGDNEVQPDALLRRPESAGGQSRLDSEGYISGAPEFIAEVAYSSASYDMHVKHTVYQRNGVLEYLVWRVRDRAVDWFGLEKGEYQALPVVEGILRSQVFAGLVLDVEALLAGDGRSVLMQLHAHLGVAMLGHAKA